MMATPKLGTLEKVDLRSQWASEAGDFTPWLADEENLAQLGAAIGMELELEATEKNVGPFRADILCKDASNGNWVLIENQLGRTDHIHLGQLLTYAAGLNAVTIVWIAAPFSEEHRAALDWLNEITGDQFSFFGLEVELWRIGNSPPAPKFNIVSKPNDWRQSVSRGATAIAEGELTETKKLQLDYWTQFRALLESTHSPVRPQKPYPQHWMNFSVGRSGFVLSTTLNSTKKRIGVELYIAAEEADAYFHLLRQNQVSIESEIGETLEWLELPERKASRILLLKHGCDPLNQDSWPELQAWMQETLEKFDKVFRPRVKALKASDWHAPPTADQDTQ